MPDMGMAIGTSLCCFPSQIGAMGNESTPGKPGWRQYVMTPSTGTIKGEFQTVLLGCTGPVVGLGVNVYIMEDIAGAGNPLDDNVLEEVSMGQMAINALGGKALGILPAVDRFLPRGPEGRHDMAGDTEGIGIRRFNHETGGQHSHGG